MTRREWLIIFWVYLGLAVASIVLDLPVTACIGVLVAVLAGYKVWYES